MGLTWVSSSAVLAIVCVLCAVWLAPRILRREDTPVLAQVDASDLRFDTPRNGLQRTAVSLTPKTSTYERESTMETPVTEPSTAATARRPMAGIRIRWDRTLIFLAGAMLLFTALLTGVMAPFTAVTWAVPTVLTLLGAGCVAGLRYLAVEEQNARRARGSVSAPVQQPEQQLFDNEDENRQDEQDRERRAMAALDLPEHVEHPQHEATGTSHEPAYTVDELRAEALKVARSTAPTFENKTTWKPVPVPKPLYTQAPVVPPREPEPLQVPQRPAAKSSTLKDAAEAGSRESAALNLDDVLKRRRA
ncbi:hypothetical protein [Kocuria sp. cx-116]|uniref:hypothetical protein n=1 Tax=Kocuria sp. cx-116 TaxID=2771378 RepID=UPI001CC24B6D|nr:hypothetical protein [Kocuria sp. cx-116]